MAVREIIDVGDTHEMAGALAEVLPARVRAPFTASFVRSARLYDEFVHRLVFSVFRASGLAAAVAGAPGTSDEIMARAGLEPGRARAPVDWILRRLSHRGILERTDGAGRPRFRLHTGVPELDPGAVREEQQREDAAWLPSYVLAETVAQDYPAFLRGERTGEEILFSPSRLRLWVDFFSNANPLYAVNNLVGAGAAEEWMPPTRLVIVELGGGDMNLPFEKQGVAPRSASLVYAVNTLHVARDLHFTLREIFEVLAPGGRLVVSECIRTTPAQAIYVEFIFNLMETFRSPVLHPTYRPNGGFLTPEQWRGAMDAAGFVEIAVLPDIAAMRARFPDFNVGAVGATRPATRT